MDEKKDVLDPVYVYRTPSKKKETPSEERTIPADFDFEQWITERWEKHPIPGVLTLAMQAASQLIFAPDGFTPEQFNERHDAWIEFWATGTSSPCNLEKFIQDGWWRKSPPKSKKRVSIEDQALAIMQEREEHDAENYQ